MDENEITKIIENQRKFFKSGKTLSSAFRREQLKNFDNLIRTHENEIYDALKEDLGKSPSESYMGEILLLKGELSLAEKDFEKWMRGRSVPTPPVHLPASSRIQPEPYGNTLIIAPWNYPFQLALLPAISAAAAGNTVILKPSEYSPATSELLKKLAEEYFSPDFLKVITGGIETAEALLKNKFDFIFYTGSQNGGRAVLRAAAEYLTPTVLELGGKSPCIVTDVKNLRSAAKRITWGKFFNAGQTCVAPDYLLVNESIKEELLKNIVEETEEFYGKNPEESRDFARIINERHFDRILSLIEKDKIYMGGKSDREKKYIAPTVVDNMTWDSKIMQEEIFGPVLPVISFSDIDEAIEQINEREKPLALYIFCENAKIKNKILENTSSGGVCVNDAVVHISTTSLPFGGVGCSGMGNYHGKAGFDAFSHHRSIMERNLGLDVKLRFPPYGDFDDRIKSFFEFMNR